MLPGKMRFAADEIDEANQFIEDLLEIIPMTVDFWDMDIGQLVGCNKAVLSLFGLSSFEDYTQNFFMLSPEYQPDGVLSSVKAAEKVQSALKNGSAHFEWMHQTVEGELIPAEVFLSRIRNRNSYYVSGFIRDLRQLDSAVSMLKHFEELAFTDELTGAFNRRYFASFAPRLIVESKKSGTPLSIIMIDIDNFKIINDTYGHLAGDYILKQMSEEIKNSLRLNDIFARYGGEEFIFLAYNMDLSDCLRVAERIRILIEDTRFVYNSIEIKVTISLGVSQIPDTCQQIEKVIDSADKALYKAKRNGRNKVEFEKCQ